MSSLRRSRRLPIRERNRNRVYAVDSSGTQIDVVADFGLVAGQINPESIWDWELYMEQPQVSAIDPTPLLGTVVHVASQDAPVAIPLADTCPAPAAGATQVPPSVGQVQTCLYPRQPIASRLNNRYFALQTNAGYATVKFAIFEDYHA